MLTEKQIGQQIAKTIKRIIELNDKGATPEQYNLYLGALLGLMTALGIDEDFRKADNPVDFCSSVLEEILSKDASNVNTFLITINTECEKQLNQYGTIVFKSILIKGLYGIKTLYTKLELENLSFVEKVEENKIGTFCD